MRGSWQPTHFLAVRLSCIVLAAVRLLKSFIEDNSISQLSSYIRVRGSSRRIGGLRFSLTRPICELSCSNSRCTVGAFSLKQLDLKIYMYECSALFLLLTLISYVSSTISRILLSRMRAYVNKYPN